jgi:phenylpyruvate tautomerase PptA (4-oxalocrotonate tautomerase family)
MPLWQLFVPEDAYTDEEKVDLGDRITKIYSDNFDLPRFYATVIFHDLRPASFLVGGEMRGKFVQVVIVHAARTAGQIAERLGVEESDVNNVFLKLAHEALEPYVPGRGYESELHVENVPHETWNIDGMEPPPPWSEVEKKWARENRSSPYVAADL